MGSQGWKILCVLLEVYQCTVLTFGRDPYDRTEQVLSQEYINDEQRLLRALTLHYEPSVRPVYDARKSVVIKLGVTLTQIIDMDEKNQVLTTNIWLDQEWYDEMMNWTSSDYNNISALRVPCDLLWLPDIVLYNSVDNHNKGYMKSLAMVQNDGKVFWPPIVRMRSSCKMDITYFPFDDQLCSLVLGSWAYDGFQVDVTNRSENVDLSNYVDNGEWELLDTKIIRRVRHYPCCPEPYVDVTFYLMIRRRVLYYFLNVIIPCMLLSCLSMIGFLLPPDSGEKVTLGLTVLLAFSVFMLLIAENMPPTSEFIPLIGIYLTVIMAMSALSVALSVFVLSCHHRGVRLNRPSRVVRALSRLVAKCLFMNIIHISSISHSLPRTTPSKSTNHNLNLKTSCSLSRNHTFPQGRRPQCRSPSSSRNNDIISASSSSSTSSHSIRTHSAHTTPRPRDAGHASHTLPGLSLGPGVSSQDPGQAMEDRILQQLQLLLRAIDKDRGVELAVLEWQEVARVVDKFCFFLFVIVTTVITVFLLCLSPLSKQIEFPLE